MTIHTSNPESESLLTLLVHTTKDFSSTVADTVAGQGLTLDEWMVLDAIHRHHGSSMSLISGASGCTGASLTRTVDKLVSNALAYREASRTDRRKVEVFLSDRGRETHRAVTEHVSGLEAGVEKLLADSGIDRAGLTSLLQNLRAVTPPVHLPVQ